MKLARVFYSLSPEKWFDFPIQEGNSFPNLILQCRSQGFILDAHINAYVSWDVVKAAHQIENADPTAGMTRQ